MIVSTGAKTKKIGNSKDSGIVVPSSLPMYYCYGRRWSGTLLCAMIIMTRLCVVFSMSAATDDYYRNGGVIDSGFQQIVKKRTSQLRYLIKKKGDDAAIAVFNILEDIIQNNDNNNHEHEEGKEETATDLDSDSDKDSNTISDSDADSDSDMAEMVISVFKKKTAKLRSLIKNRRDTVTMAVFNILEDIIDNNQNSGDYHHDEQGAIDTETDINTDTDAEKDVTEILVTILSSSTAYIRELLFGRNTNNNNTTAITTARTPANSIAHAVEEENNNSNGVDNVWRLALGRRSNKNTSSTGNSINASDSSSSSSSSSLGWAVVESVRHYYFSFRSVLYRLNHLVLQRAAGKLIGGSAAAASATNPAAAAMNHHKVSSFIVAQTTTTTAIDRWARTLVLYLGSAVVLQSVGTLLRANDHQLFDELADRWLSNESATAVKSIRNILTSVEDHGVVDVFAKHPPQDVLVAIYALSRLQRAYNYYLDDTSNPRQTNNNTSDSNSNTACSKKKKKKELAADNEKLLNELSHYAVYANAAYGWKMDLAFRGRIHLGDLQTLLKKTGIQREDVVATNWESKTHCPAFFLVRDKKLRKLVLCIRGTWSPRDILTDLCCTAEAFEAPAAPPPPSLSKFRTTTTSKPTKRMSYRAHHGMLESARSVARLLEEVIAKELELHPDYKLAIVGHSLGGGVAALLGLLWKNVFHNKLAVYAFGAPCVAPLDTAYSLRDIMVSVIGEGDPFSCLSIGHVADVSVALSNLASDKELRSSILFRTRRIDDMQECDVEWCKEVVENRLYHRDGQDNEVALSGNASSSSSSNVQNNKQEKMYPPGRIIFLSTSSTVTTSSASSSISSSSFASEDEYFNFAYRRRNYSDEINGNHDNNEDDDENDKNKNSNNKNNDVTVYEVLPDFFQDLSVTPRMFDVTRHIPSLYESRLQKLLEKSVG